MLGVVPDLSGTVLGEGLVKVAERLHDGRGALHVGVIDHDVTCWQVGGGSGGMRVWSER